METPTPAARGMVYARKPRPSLSAEQINQSTHHRLNSGEDDHVEYRTATRVRMQRASIAAMERQAALHRKRSHSRTRRCQIPSDDMDGEDGDYSLYEVDVDADAQAQKRMRASDWPLTRSVEAIVNAMDTAEEDAMDLDERIPVDGADEDDDEEEPRRGRSPGPAASARHRRRSSAKSTARKSRFLEASMSDRASEKPPSFFTRYFKHGASLAEDVGGQQDDLMDDYHNSAPSSRSTSAVRHPRTAAPPRTVMHTPNLSASHSTAGASTDTKASAGVFRFGKSLSTLNPVSIWHKVTTSFVKEPSADEPEIDPRIRELDERNARAQQAYAELKRAGQLGTLGSRPLPAGTRVRAEGYTRPMSTQPTPSQWSPSEGRNARRPISLDAALHGATAPPMPTRDAPPPPPSAPETSPSRKPSAWALGLLKTPSFPNLKRMRSDVELEPATTGKASKEAERRRRLSKRVSDLETKLESARRELAETIARSGDEEIPPVPPVPETYSAFFRHRGVPADQDPGVTPSWPLVVKRRVSRQTSTDRSLFARRSRSEVREQRTSVQHMSDTEGALVTSQIYREIESHSKLYIRRPGAAVKPSLPSLPSERLLFPEQLDQLPNSKDPSDHEDADMFPDLASWEPKADNATGVDGNTFVSFDETTVTSPGRTKSSITAPKQSLRQVAIDDDVSGSVDCSTEDIKSRGRSTSRTPRILRRTSKRKLGEMDTVYKPTPDEPETDDDKEWRTARAGRRKRRSTGSLESKDGLKGVATTSKSPSKNQPAPPASRPASKPPKGVLVRSRIPKPDGRPPSRQNVDVAPDNKTQAAASNGQLLTPVASARTSISSAASVPIDGPSTVTAAADAPGFATDATDDKPAPTTPGATAETWAPVSLPPPPSATRSRSASPVKGAGRLQPQPSPAGKLRKVPREETPAVPVVPGKREEKWEWPDDVF